MKQITGKIMMASALALGVSMMMAIQAGADPITPLSYAYAPSTPPVNYPDSGGELTNGIIGTTSFSDPQWVGFHVGVETFPVKVTFDFGSVTNFTGISIYGLNYPAAGIAPMTTFTVSYSTNGSTFGGAQVFNTTAAEQAGNPAVEDYSRALSGAGRYIQLSMDTARPSGQPYLFVSEVDFQAVPEPSTVALMAAGAGTIFLKLRRRQTR